MKDAIHRLILERPLIFTTSGFLRRRVLDDFFVQLHLRALRESERNGKRFRDAIQSRKLQRLLRSAARLSFWKERIVSKLLDAEDPVSLLSSMPVTTKIDLRGAPLKERTNRHSITKHGVLTATSGSTGEPLQFFIDKRMKIRSWALLARVGGLQKFSRRSLIHLWPTQNPNPLFDGHFFSAKTSEELWLQRSEIYELAAQPNSILHGSPSVLRFLVEFIQQDGATLRPRVILTSSELLTPQIQLLFEEQFQCSVVSYYGSRELSVMAGRCESCRFHENSEDIIFETVSERGLPVRPGEIGRLVVTGLNSHIAPFIRYYLGDYGFFYPDACPCGSTLPSFNFEGRTHDVAPILLPDGSQILPYRLTGVFNKRFRKIRQYQIDHYAPYSFMAYIVPVGNYAQHDEQELLADFRRVTQNSRVEVRYVTSIPSKGSKILPYVKSFDA